MSTETQQPHELDKFQVWWNYHGQYCRAGGGEYEESFAWSAWQAAQASQAAELATLKEKIARYEAHGVTCQTYGHVVGACAECNTHEESPEALKADMARQATEIEVLRKTLDFARGEFVTFTFHLSRGDFELSPSLKEQCIRSVNSKIAAIDAAMQTKETS